jgi:hemerythrin
MFFRKSIQGIIEFTVRHIETEEEILSKKNYDKFEEHKTEHKK